MAGLEIEYDEKVSELDERTNDMGTATTVNSNVNNGCCGCGFKPTCYWITNIWNLLFNLIISVILFLLTIVGENYWILLSALFMLLFRVSIILYSGFIGWKTRNPNYNNINSFHISKTFIKINRYLPMSFIGLDLIVLGFLIGIIQYIEFYPEMDVYKGSIRFLNNVIFLLSVPFIIDILFVLNYTFVLNRQT